MPAPPAATTREQPPAAAPAPLERRSLKILLVEDNRDTLHFLALILRQLGHEVRTAASVDEARAKLTAELDLLISDIELPDGSGLDLMRELEGGRSLPGIAMSGLGSAEDLQFSRDAGFAAHLTKPIDVARLEAAIQQFGVRRAGIPGETDPGRAALGLP